MAFVRLNFISMIFILGGFWTVEAMSLSASEGTQLSIKCSHSYANGNIKYFCNKQCEDKDVLITSEVNQSNKKYSLKDEGNTFYVTISDLSLDDSGVYWCGVSRVGVDTYNKVVITVTPKTTEDLLPDDSPQSNVSSTQKLLYIGGGLSALLLILLTAIVTFIKYRHRVIRKPMAGEEESEVTYATPMFTTQKPSQDSTCSSANQSLDPDLTRSTSCTYANIQTDKHIEPPVYSELKK